MAYYGAPEIILAPPAVQCEARSPLPKPVEADADVEMEVARYRPESIDSLVAITKFTRKELQTMYRGFKQECPSGTVNEETFRDIYAQFFPQGDSSAYSHFVFRTFDTSRCGTITFKDFVCGLSTLARGTVDEKLRWAFSLYDLNDDGQVTRSEMLDIVTSVYEMVGKAVQPAINVHTPREHVDYVFEKMDLNRDGVITLNEFLEVCGKDDTIRKSLTVLDTVL